MSTIDLPILLTSITALAAVIGPVVSTCITVRSNERLRRDELYAPKLYSAISQVIVAFHRLHRKDDFITYAGWDLDLRTKSTYESYTNFSVSCFELMSLLPDEGIRSQLTDLLSVIGSAGFQVSPENEVAFNQIVSEISHFLSRVSSKHRHAVKGKRKVGGSKNNGK